MIGDAYCFRSGVNGDAYCFRSGVNGDAYCFRSGVNGDAYYLARELAVLERRLVNGLVDRLQATGLQHVVCPDMVKPFIAVSPTLFSCFDFLRFHA